jgi:hypothetical protein
MANRDNPSGFKVARHANGGVARPNRYYIASALASNIFRGDAVIPVNTNKRINVAATTNRLIGVFQGVAYVQPNGEFVDEKFWPTGQTLKTGTVAEALVWDDPNLLFEVQGDEDIVEADIGAMADIVAGTGSTSTGISAHELDSSNIGTGDTLRIEQFVDRPDNERGANFARVLVRISKHYLAGAATAI